MVHKRLRIALVLIGVVASGIQTAIPAEFKLGSRFQDADGDMVADTPSDPGKQIDPGTLIFAYTPVGDPAVYVKFWKGFLEYMEKVTGKEVQVFAVQSNAAQIEAMRAGRLHIAGFNTGSNPIAVACAGFKPFAMMAREDNSFGYEMEIITYPGDIFDRGRATAPPHVIGKALGCKTGWRPQTPTALLSLCRCCDTRHSAVRNRDKCACRRMIDSASAAWYGRRYLK